MLKMIKIFLVFLITSSCISQEIFAIGKVSATDRLTNQVYYTGFRIKNKKWFIDATVSLNNNKTLFLFSNYAINKNTFIQYSCNTGNVKNQSITFAKKII